MEVTVVNLVLNKFFKKCHSQARSPCEMCACACIYMSLLTVAGSQKLKEIKFNVKKLLSKKTPAKLCLPKHTSLCGLPPRSQSAAPTALNYHLPFISNSINRLKLLLSYCI